MKVILSRKGFDSGAGGGSSPILPDGTLISIPIPDEGVNLKYSELQTTQGLSYYELLRQLGYKKITLNDESHLDPDIVKEVLHREKGWKACFGQSNQSQSHLRSNDVCEGSIFLFFGRFGKTEEIDGEYRFINKQNPQHIIWGYMQINEIIHLHDDSKQEQNKQWLKANQWVNRHPHVVEKNRKNNTLYVASETLILPNGKVLPGFGTFKYNPSLLLTEEEQPYLCNWKLPACLHPKNGTTMTYHGNPNLWTSLKDEKYVRLKSMARGQEFVINGSTAIEWALKLIEMNKVESLEMAV